MRCSEWTDMRLDRRGIFKANVDELVSTPKFNVSASEREFLIRGVAIWGGPTRLTNALSLALGFNGIDDLYGRIDDFVGMLEREDLVESHQWAQILALTEIAFASRVFGAGWEWSVVTGYSDDESLALLRTIQSKIPGLKLTK